MLSTHAVRRLVAGRQHGLALRMLPLVLLTLGLFLAFGAGVAPTVHADSPHVDTVTFAADVDPGSASFISGVIDTAQHDGATLLLIKLDTPGGDLESMKQIVQKELASAVPIVVYISPAGGRAGSAGTFVALAAPVVAMAPNTRIGAASPVDSTGSDLPATLDAKIKNDLEAEMRSLQSQYHRNVDLAVSTIESAKAYDASEAIDQNLVNLGAATQDELLARLDGTATTLSNGSAVTLHTAGLPVAELEQSLGDQIKSVLFDPTVVFILFIVAAICIYLELSHPGAIVPGTVGAIALVLFLYGAGSLNPNWAGLVLMLLAIALLAVDVRVPTHGVLTVGALISLVIGSFIFFNSNADQGGTTLNPLLIGAFAAAVGLVSLIVLQYAIRAQRRPITTGHEGLLGKKARIIEPLAPEGRVVLQGENWAARLSERVAAKGVRLEPPHDVRVVAIEGLTLIVEPLQPV